MTQDHINYAYKNQLIWTMAAIFVAIVAAVSVSVFLVKALISPQLAAAHQQPYQVVPAVMEAYPASVRTANTNNGTACNSGGDVTMNQASNNSGGSYGSGSSSGSWGSSSGSSSSGTYSAKKYYYLKPANTTYNQTSNYSQTSSYSQDNSKAYTKNVNSHNAFDSYNTETKTKTVSIDDSFNHGSNNTTTTETTTNNTTEDSFNTEVETEVEVDTTIINDSFNKETEYKQPKHQYPALQS